MKKTLVALAVAAAASSAQQEKPPALIRDFWASEPPKPKVNKWSIYQNKGK